MTTRDVLAKIPDENLPELLELYRKNIENYPHAVSLINLKIQWLRKGIGAGILNFYTPANTPKQDGTFVAIKQIGTTYDVFTFTLSDSFDILRDALMETKTIDYARVHLFSMAHSDHLEMIKAVATFRGKTPKGAQPVDMFSIPQKVAANFTTASPPGTSLKKLHPNMAGLINSVWPHRYENSENYLRKIIELNGGYGVFLEETDDLVAWVVKNINGQIGMLQTLEGHTKKGYAAALVKAISKEIAEEGNNPFGTVDLGNVASQNLFKKLGFTSKGVCYYIFFY